MNTKDMMDVLGKRAAAAIPQNTEDYVEDGILFCGRCHTAKQARVMITGKETLFASPCMCEKEKDADRDLKKKSSEREKQRKKTFRGIDSLCLATFEADDGARPGLVARLKKYVEIFESAKKDGYGLILCGASGTGKTFHACQIANALIDTGKRVIFTDFYSFENEIALSKNRVESIEAYSLADVVILDDFGAWTESAYKNGLIYQLTNHLYLSRVPTIITTNMSAKQLGDLAHLPLYRRILERGHLIPIDDTVNRSKQLAKSNAEKYGAMLSP